MAFPSRSFVLFWRAHAVSGLGTYVTLLALQALVVLDLGGSATEVGWLSSARWLPFLVVGVVVGALVDRRPRRPVAVVADLVAAVLLAAVPLLWWTDVLTFPVLLLVVVAYGTASVVSTAATTALLPRLVAPADLQRAHARTDGADAAAMTAGPALGGLLVSALGAPLAVLADALTYLFSAATLARVEVEEPAPVRGARVRALLGEIRDGVVWIYRTSGLATLAVATHVWFVGHAVVGVVLAPYALVLRDGTGRAGAGAGSLRAGDGGQQLPRDELPPAADPRRSPGPHQHHAALPQPRGRGRGGAGGRGARRRLGVRRCAAPRGRRLRRGRRGPRCVAVPLGPRPDLT